MTHLASNPHPAIPSAVLVILSAAKDLAPTPETFFAAGVRSFAALRTTEREDRRIPVILSPAKDLRRPTEASVAVPATRGKGATR